MGTIKGGLVKSMTQFWTHITIFSFNDTIYIAANPSCILVYENGEINSLPDQYPFLDQT